MWYNSIEYIYRKININSKKMYKIGQKFYRKKFYKKMSSVPEIMGHIKGYCIKKTWDGIDELHYVIQWENAFTSEYSSTIVNSFLNSNTWRLANGMERAMLILERLL